MESTNWFEQYYKELVKYAEFCIEQKQIPVQPEDLVNDAYIKFFESGEEFDLKKVKSIINGGSFREYSHKRGQDFFGERYPSKQKITGDKCCTICKEVKPVNAFRLQKFQGYNYVFNQCKSCLSKVGAQWHKDHSEWWNEYCRQWQSKKKGRLVLPWDEHLKRVRSNMLSPEQRAANAAKFSKKYAKKRSENLTDSYIIQVLKQRKKPFTPKDIEVKRQELFEKRRMKAA